MPFEFLERKKKAIEDVISAYRAFQNALQELPSEWAREVLEELVGGSSGATVPPVAATPPLAAPVPQNTPQLEDLPSPTDAVRELLRRHPEGMRPSHVVHALTGKVRTTSDRPAKLLYSVLGTLKKSGEVKKGTDGRYRFTAQTNEQDG